MSAEAEQGAGRKRRRRRVAVSASMLAVAVVGGLWLSRVPIATGVIDRELAKRGVPARYGIADLGFGRQRLTNVVIGDPARPDLVADWIETVTDVGLSGARVTAIRAGHVRLRGNVVDGKLSLGAIDRLLPAGEGGATTLPAIDLALGDGRMRLETPFGVAGVALSGRGRLDKGFSGRVALVSELLGTGGCTARSVTAQGAVRSIGDNGLTFSGPVRGSAIDCGGARIETARAVTDARVLLGKFAASSLQAEVATGAITHPQARAAGMSGTIGVGSVDGALRLTTRLAAQRVSAAGVRAGRVAIDGAITRDPVQMHYAGKVAAADADVRRLLPALEGIGVGTPVAPLVRRAGIALGQAAARASGEANLSIMRDDGGWHALVHAAQVAAASGARATLEGDMPLDWRDGGRFAGTGRLAMRGGGLPVATIAYDKRGYAAALSGSATIAPYAADGARLALAPVRFGGGRVTTVATVSGPLGDGRVERLVLPVDARAVRGGWSVNAGCTPVAFEALAIAGLSLTPARMTLCPTGASLVSVTSAGITGGARIAAPRLAGRLGGTPLTLAASGAEVAIGAPGFSIAGLEARLGAPGAVTRLDVARLDGRVTREGLSGTLSGGAGQIGNVPLLMSGADGTWEMAHGKLAVFGALTVADAAPEAERRFNPLAAREVVLGLANGEIGATARLVEPETGADVARVAIGHRLGPGSGAAVIAVPGLTFGDTLQPDRLTPLTFGVIADVKGTVTGEGRIAWDANGVTSTGTFSTQGTDLAAAFGPVTGLSGTIRFTDLLALESAPGQVATVASINTGVEVTDGRIVYQTLPGTRVRVDSGRWPFAGGTLTLEPTTLDFDSDATKHMTFRIDAMQAGQFLQQFDFANLNATGTFDGVLPMAFDQSGGRIEGGRLVARAGGGSVAYLGDLTRKDLGFWGDFAFRSLRSLTYRNLDVTMNGPLAGEMVTAVAIAGVRQGEGAESNFLLRRLTRLPIRFNITIRAPFRGLIDSAASFYDPQRLVKRNLQQLLDEQERRTRPIQPPASETVP